MKLSGIASEQLPRHMMPLAASSSDHAGVWFGAVQHRERVHVGDRLGVGAGRDLVHRAAGAVEELQVDLAAVELVVLREEVDVALVRLLRGGGADVGAGALDARGLQRVLRRVADVDDDLDASPW